MKEQVDPTQITLKPVTASMPQVKRTSKLASVIAEEFSSLQPRYLLVQFFVSLLPHNSFSRVRTLLYRMAGLKIGPKAMILGKLTLTSNQPISKMLTIGGYSRINAPFYAELNAPVTIGEQVAIGHHVVLITTDHETTLSWNRCGASTHLPITIEDGAWIGAGATILPGVTIGAGSIVAAGSLVSQ